MLLGFQLKAVSGNELMYWARTKPRRQNPGISQTFAPQKGSYTLIRFGQRHGYGISSPQVS